MFHILYKYLLINRQVSIPGIGVFKLVDQPAKIDLQSRVINPPHTAIEYTNSSATADKNFFRFASTEMQVEDWDTIRRFHDFTYKLKNELDKEHTVELPAMGFLTKDDSGNIAFKPKKIHTEVYPVVDLKDLYNGEPVNEHLLQPDEIMAEETLIVDSTNAPSTGRLWWIAAIVIAVLSAAAIIYYYLQVDVRV